jgi:cation diffusion facilitator CzcD-associated flavoprotein CzcO
VNSVTNFDAIVIGAGQAGPPLAKRLTKAGMSVAIVERHLFGGTCVYAKAPYAVLRHTMHIHPTVSEYIPSLLEN